MKKTILFLALAVLAGIVSCNKKEDPTFDVNVQLMVDNAVFAQTDVVVELAETAGLTTYEGKTNASGAVAFKVPAGTYDVSASFKTVVEGVTCFYSGSTKLVVAANADNKFSLALTKVEKQQIIIKELYSTGCAKEGGSFSDDAYVVLYNNSDTEADASDIVFCISHPYNAHASNKYITDGVLLYENAGWLPAPSGIWMFNGTVKIAPYSSLVVACFGAIDHTVTYPNSVNLGKAEYYVMSKEGCTQLTAAKYAVADVVPTSHYLTAKMSNAGTAWLLSNTAPAFFIGRMSASEVASLIDNKDDYDKTNGTSAALMFPKFPSAKVVDAVDVWDATQVSKSNLRFPTAINSGHVEITGKLGHTIYRNVDKEATEALPENKGILVYNYKGGVGEASANGTDPSGIDAEASIKAGAHIVYLDTNNSAKDFHERAVSSLK